MDEKTLTRFMAKVDQSGDCWTWIGAKIPEGYGSFWCKGRQQGAHRLSFEHFNGNIAAGLVIDHRCRNRACVNPAHLDAVTVAENNLRGVGAPALNALKTHCPKGHAYTATNTRRVKATGARVCRACASLYEAGRRAARKAVTA